jgi:hypothetical protein
MMGGSSEERVIAADLRGLADSEAPAGAGLE